ncbi:hypothetical protein PsorP6_012724 [Peronosclerospora sorghi]|uniref:Uncharacterized protein n=1 Tax=Peronosclerospora sorghi TaxID=230839 RepID=A0ACC0WHJ3_9STRA|nr:hypothetical protein PsorP6_012724 [Peronosclerospora sorghi]
MSIVEMGTGSAYWARLLQLCGVDVIAYDVHTADDIEEEKESRNKEVDNIRSAAPTSKREMLGQKKCKKVETRNLRMKGKKKKRLRRKTGMRYCKFTGRKW